MVNKFLLSLSSVLVGLFLFVFIVGSLLPNHVGLSPELHVSEVEGISYSAFAKFSRFVRNVGGGEVAFSPSCVDNDPEGDPDVAGVCIDGHGRRYEDRCASGSYISYQYKCAPNGINCIRDKGTAACTAGYGCTGSNVLNDGNPGACASDSPVGDVGGDSGSAGGVSDPLPDEACSDVCVLGARRCAPSSNSVEECVHSGAGCTIWTSHEICLGAGSVCSGGSCVVAESSTSNNCEDSDSNDNVHVRGYVDKVGQSRYYDICRDSTRVQESYCGEGGGTYYHIKSCPNGEVCSNGICSATVTTVSEETQSDSTGGLPSLRSQEVSITGQVGNPPTVVFSSGEAACAYRGKTCSHIAHNCGNTGAENTWIQSNVGCSYDFFSSGLPNSCVHAAGCVAVDETTPEESFEDGEQRVIMGALPNSLYLSGQSACGSVGKYCDRVERNCVNLAGPDEWFSSSNGCRTSFNAPAFSRCLHSAVCLDFTDTSEETIVDDSEEVVVQCSDSDSTVAGYQPSEKFSAGKVSVGTTTHLDRCDGESRISEVFCLTESESDVRSVSCGGGYVCLENSDGVAYCDRAPSSPGLLESLFGWLFGN